jgi:aminoglycoside 3-N-acetyltransferase
VIREATPGRPPGAPVSRELLAADLRRLGLRRGQDLLIHCSLRQIGPLEAGATTLLDALLDVAGPEATLVVPVQTTLNSLTSRDFHAAVAGLDEDERARFVAAMPGFDPAQTPSRGMGAFAEYLRMRPSAVRSHHPQASFAALGPRARACTSVHDLDCHLGDRSPLGWLYAADAVVLLLGVGYTACTAFHLAEYRLPWTPPVQLYRCFTAEAGRRVELEFTAAALDDCDFARLGAALEAITPAALGQGPVGSGTGRMVPLRAAVDFGVSWMTIHRRRSCPEKPLSHCSCSRPVLTMVPSIDGAGRGWRVIMTPRCGFPARELPGGMPLTGELIRSGSSAGPYRRECGREITGEAVEHDRHQ